MALTVLDASTGLVLSDVSASATSGSRSYAFDGPSSSGVLYVMAPAGVYTVTASRAGYTDWSRANVIVRDAGDPCPGAITESVEARLQAAPE